VLHVSYTQIIIASSALATAGGLLMLLFIPASKPVATKGVNYKIIFPLFRLPQFRSAPVLCGSFQKAKIILQNH